MLGAVWCLLRESGTGLVLFCCCVNPKGGERDPTSLTVWTPPGLAGTPNQHLLLAVPKSPFQHGTNVQGYTGPEIMSDSGAATPVFRLQILFKQLLPHEVASLLPQAPSTQFSPKRNSK